MLFVAVDVPSMDRLTLPTPPSSLAAGAGSWTAGASVLEGDTGVTLDASLDATRAEPVGLDADAISMMCANDPRRADAVDRGVTAAGELAGRLAARVTL